MSSKGIEFKSTELSLSIQKKLFGRMAKKNVVKHLIDDTSAHLLDNLHQINKLFLAEYPKFATKDSEKIVKHLIKIIIKIAILVLNDQFDEMELSNANRLQSLLRSILMAIVSFHEVEFSYDRAYLIDTFQSCQRMLKQLVKPHLSDKSLHRIDVIFNFVTNQKFLDRFFTCTENDTQGAQFYKVKSEMIADINKLLEKKII